MEHVLPFVRAIHSLQVSATGPRTATPLQDQGRAAEPGRSVAPAGPRSPHAGSGGRHSAGSRAILNAAMRLGEWNPDRPLPKPSRLTVEAGKIWDTLAHQQPPPAFSSAWPSLPLKPECGLRHIWARWLRKQRKQTAKARGMVYLRACSQKRSWLPTDGQEWLLLANFPCHVEMVHRARVGASQSGQVFPQPAGSTAEHQAVVCPKALPRGATM